MAGKAATNLTNENISETFYGVLHAGGTNISPIGRTQIYDGNGGQTALALGLVGQGAIIHGTSTTVGPVIAHSVAISGAFSGGSIGVTGDITGNRVLTTQPIANSMLPNFGTAGTVTGLVNSITTDSKGRVQSVTTTQTPYKAYASVVYAGSPGWNINQGTNFYVEGYNISGILWLSTGFYRVYFNTPMANTNYVPILQLCAFSSESGKLPAGSKYSSTENVLIVSFKSTNFFEFYCRTDDSNREENLTACGILVI